MTAAEGRATSYSAYNTRKRKLDMDIGGISESKLGEFETITKASWCLLNPITHTKTTGVIDYARHFSQSYQHVKFKKGIPCLKYWTFNELHQSDEMGFSLGYKKEGTARLAEVEPCRAEDSPLRGRLEDGNQARLRRCRSSSRPAKPSVPILAGSGTTSFATT